MKLKRSYHSLFLLALVALAGVFSVVGPAQGVPPAPIGVTALALDGRVQLSWSVAQGATGYRVYRSATPGGAGTLVSPAGLSSTSFSDAGVVNGQAGYYTVRAVAAGEESSASRIAGATPRAASCSTGNTIVRENCFPGTTAWKVDSASAASNSGIEGFTSQPSVDAGQSVDVKITTGSGAPYHVEIYRTGWYGGSQGRLVGTLEGLTGVAQPACVRATDATGLRSCSNWSTSATLTTTTAWPSGVYVLKLVREDNGRANQALLIVRDDDGSAPLHYNIPDATYQAYNNHGGRSVYPSNSSGDNTVAGTPQAVKVSFDRPYQQTATRQRDFYTFTDLSAVSWLERQGYSISYSSSIDMHRGIPGLNSRQAIVLGSHHEYWSAEMRSRLTAARDAGVDVLSLGANQIYWKIRFESGERTQVVYKTTATGVQDPSGVNTGTWRDPAGANQPENALLGSMYVGDNDSVSFPLRVPYVESRHRVWRHTGAASQAPGQTTSIGTTIVGWEWDARVNNGQEPAGVETLSVSPVNGNLLQDAGRVYAPGNATVNATIYRAASGAYVFNAGTNYWARGLAPNSRGQGNVQPAIQQATANLLSDMGVRPSTPTGITLDPAGPLVVEWRSPADGAASVPLGSVVRARFDRAVDPATLTTSSFTLRPTGGGAAVAASVSWDDENVEAVLDPAADLAAGTEYTATLTTDIGDGTGGALSAPVAWRFTTEQPSAPTVIGQAPDPGATGVSPSTDVSATFDRPLDAATVNGASFRLETPSGAAVPAAPLYDAQTRVARLEPSEPLDAGTTYTARLTTAIRSSDGAALAAPVSWSFTTSQAFTVTGRVPAPLAFGVSTYTAVRATLSLAADPATVTTTTFLLEGPGAAGVTATVSYDPATRVATLRPSAPLAVMTTYTARLSSGVHASDGQSLTPTSWTFTTASSPPPAPAVTWHDPATEATEVDRAANVRAELDRALDPSTIDGTTVQLRDPAGTQLAASVSYDAATRTITLDPTAPLSRETRYTARLTTGLRSQEGVPLAADVAWSFTTLQCPCALMEDLAPASTGNPTRDNRALPGPWSYELGTKIEVARPMDLTSIRFYKDSRETGAHRGTVWSTDGTVLAQVDFSSETASGWQSQALTQRVRLQPGNTYIVSVGLNAYYVLTQFGLQTPLTSGPLSSVAVTSNGVYGSAAGVFPTQSWRQSNYFVDAQVSEPPLAPTNPTVVSTSPAADATGVGRSSDVRARFDRSLDPSTVNSTTFALRDAGGGTVAATVSYDDATHTAGLVPSAQLSAGAVYTARLTTDIRSAAGLALADQYEWSFTVASDVPGVASTSPSAGATQVSRDTEARATFTTQLDPTSVTTSTFTLTPDGGSAAAATVSYDDATRTARLVPTAQLAPQAVYTARLTTGVRSSDGTPLPSDVTWTFTTGDCPCSLFGGLTPVITNASTRDGRPSPGPWTRELGLKFEVTEPVQLRAFRYYKASSETGAHTGRLWTESGTLLGSQTFNSGTASGWQEQALDTPIELVPGQVYVASVGFNTYYSATQFGLQTQVVNGPLRSTAVASNGVYSSASGIFPTSSYRSSNYFVDVVVR